MILLGKNPNAPILEEGSDDDADDEDDDQQQQEWQQQQQERQRIIDLLRSLPAHVVANHIYPFAVKIIENREELIVAVDEYLDNDDDDVGNNRIRYPIGDWDVSRVTGLTRSGTPRPSILTKICPDGT
jgi:hypothetical protein